MTMDVRFLRSLTVAALLAAGCSTPAPSTSGLQIDPGMTSVPVGLKVQFTVVATSNGMAQDAGPTGIVGWSVSDPMIASIDSSGLATGLKTGTVTVTAKTDTLMATATLQVTDGVLKAITVTPDGTKIAKGTPQAFMAMGAYTDGSTKDLTGSVTWASSDVSIATIDGKGNATAVSEGTVEITASAPGYAPGGSDGGVPTVTGSAKLTVGGAVLAQIDITPAMGMVPAGLTLQYTATGTYTDGTKADLTSAVTWATMDSGVATVSKLGLVTGVAAGMTSLTATIGMIAGTQGVTVTAATLMSIAVTPPNPSVASGNTLQLTATATFSDMTTMDVTASATWATVDMTIATVGSGAMNDGLLSGLMPGATMVSATLMGVTGMAPVTVTNAVLKSIAVTPMNPQVPVGTTVQLTATGTFSDNSVQDLTSSATWSSSDMTIATVGNKGLVTGVKPSASATVTASLNGIMGTTTVSVTSAVLQSISVTPTNPAIPNGTTQQFVATGLYSDLTNQNLTSLVTWSSSNMAAASISNAANSAGLATGLSVGSTMVSATLNGVMGGTTLAVTPAVLKSISITPANDTIAKGTSEPLTATGTYSDNTTQNITSTVTWASDNAAVAVSNANGSQGQVTGVSVGKANVTATLMGVVGTTTLTVSSATLASISVTPANPTIPKGTTLHLTATGIYSDNSTQDLTSTVTWSSADANTVAVSNALGSQGLVTGVDVTMGTAITATSGNVSGSTTVVVSSATLASITITPPNPTVSKGTTLQLTATGVYTDNTTLDLTSTVQWSVDKQNIATVSNAMGSQGVVTGVDQGQATVTATLGNISGSTLLNVSAAALSSIVITPANPTIANGTSIQLNATGVYTDMSTQNLTSTVTWSVDKPAIATISNAMGSQGVAAGVAQGVATVTATFGQLTGTTALTVSAATLTAIAVTPANSTIAKGTSLQFVATGIYSDNSTQNLTSNATWASDNVNVATVSNANGSQGLASGVAAGTANVSATVGQITGTTQLTVTAATLSSIAVSPASITTAKGTSVQFTATGVYTDSSTQNLTSTATWSSSDNKVATVSNSNGTQGLAFAVAASAQPVTITAAVGNMTGTAQLTVTAATLTAISITPTNPSLAKGTTVQLTATGTYSDNSTQDLTAQVNWSTVNPAIASVSNVVGSQGLATANGAGMTNVNAALSGVTGTTTINVTAATLSSVTVTPVNPTVALGTSVRFIATGTYSDHSTQDLTSAATWSSSQGNVASISNAPGSQGRATTLQPGNTTITASVGGKSGSTVLNVTNAVLKTIVVTPANPSIAAGTYLQFTATGTYSNNTTQDITTQATRSSSTNAATISNANGTQGLAYGNRAGTPTITATQGGVSGSTVLTVTAATLTSIAVTPANPTIAKGTTIRFTATGTFSDQSTQNLTAQVTWSSSNGAVATVSNAAGSHGLATGLSSGKTTITAAFNGVMGSTTLTVTNAALVSITVTPVNPTIKVGTTQQFTATGTFSDNTTQNVTSQVTWGSSNTAVAIVSNTGGAKGLATAIAVGTSTITATFTTNGVAGSTVLTVL